MKDYTQIQKPDLGYSYEFATDGGDMIAFAHRTYHGAFPNSIDETRLSCAIGFRDRAHRIDLEWRG